MLLTDAAISRMLPFPTSETGNQIAIKMLSADATTSCMLPYPTSEQENQAVASVLDATAGSRMLAFPTSETQTAVNVLDAAMSRMFPFSTFEKGDQAVPEVIDVTTSQTAIKRLEATTSHITHPQVTHSTQTLLPE